MTRKNLVNKRVFLDPTQNINARVDNSSIAQICQIQQTYKLNSNDSTHWIRILRANVGQELEVVCRNSGIVYTAVIDQIIGESLCVKLIEEVSTQESQFNQHLFIGLPKSKSLELLIEKSVELGVRSINIWEAKHSIAKIKENKQVRLEKIIESAAKQSKQAVLPKLNIFETKSELEKRLTELKEEHAIGFICCLEENTEVIQSIKDLHSKHPQLIAVGPEGDFSPEEVKFFLNHGFRAISLGNSVLRTETAAICALAMLQARSTLK